MTTLSPPASDTPSFEELAHRCLEDCAALADQSEWHEGILRQYLSLPMKAVHELSQNWMAELGMEARVDDAGNLIGRRASAAASAPIVLTGSHLDTVPGAGKYDGVLGFVMGLALARSLGTAELPFHIDVIGFSEEEGVRFSKPYLGSHAITGTFDLEWLSRRDASGFSMKSVIEGFGLVPQRIPSAAYRPSEVIAFVEPHIEQGVVLSRADLPVGVVEAIAGQTRALVQFVGIAGHAGTTPMYPRQDALVAAASWITEVSRRGCEVTGCRATVGYADVSPNVRNVIPDRVTLSLDLRHIDDGIRKQSVGQLFDIARGIAVRDNVEFVVLEKQEQSGVAMDDVIRKQLFQAASDCDLEALDLISGAGHDAGLMASRFPTAMIFIRQPRGISHHPDEDVEASDIAEGLRVLRQWVLNLAEGINSNG
ncbi:MAG: Zn-dependent hydrolase [Planctomycetota bacterium]